MKLMTSSMADDKNKFISFVPIKDNILRIVVRPVKKFPILF